jgi:hypothetical protein
MMIIAAAAADDDVFRLLSRICVFTKNSER